MDRDFLLQIALGGIVAAAFVWLASQIWRRHRAARLPLALLPAGLGAFFAYGTLSERNAYVAGLVFGFPWITSATLALGSGVLFLIPSTRRSSWCGVAAAGLILVTFYLLIGAALILGFRWHENPLVPISRLAEQTRVTLLNTTRAPSDTRRQLPVDERFAVAGGRCDLQAGHRRRPRLTRDA